MKYVVAILINICVYTYTAAQTLTTYYYPDSTIASQGIIEHGKPNGYWINYYEHGSIKSKGLRRNFELDSIWNFYTPEGNLASTISYANGKKNGEYIHYSFYKDSNYVESVLPYSNDVLHGEARYYSRGALIKTVQYREGKLHGHSFDYDSSGMQTALYVYNAGELVQTKTINRTNAQGEKHGVWMNFFPNGTVQSEAYYNKNKLQGLYKLYNQRQELLQVGNYDNDSLLYSSQSLQQFKEPIERTTMHNDSTIASRGFFIDSLPIGMHTFYDANGKLLRAYLYDSLGLLRAEGAALHNGEKHGEWKFYDAKNITAVGTFKSGQKHGAWTYYYANGTIKQTGEYMNNALYGLWTYYDESARVITKETYSMNKKNGDYEQYNANGQKIIWGTYIDERKHGTWTYSIGDITTTGAYEYGDKTREWKTYYTATNTLQFKGSYYMGKPHGKHIYYYENGTIEHIELYKHSVEIKKWSYYNAQGELLYIVHYKRGKEIKIDVLTTK